VNEQVRDILDVLNGAVLAGGVAVLEVQRRGSIGANYKDATEIVTDADRASDAAILGVFQRRFPAIDPSISFHLEESGVTGTPGRRRAGADPLDGTAHFAAGGNLYSVQAHYIEDGVPLVGVILQPEAYRPLSPSGRSSGRLASAVHGQGAIMRAADYDGERFQLGEAEPLVRKPMPKTRTFIGCVPITGKMNDAERGLVRTFYDSGVLGGVTGTGNAGGNVMMAILGGHQIYCNFGAGDELDLVPGQVVAEEAGLTVWGTDRRRPVWHVRKQPVIFAPDAEAAERCLSAAGL
jgi:3'-phosphoadenosine 5'-phosphosulfate (PAPS) 3'-phosphatase